MNATKKILTKVDCKRCGGSGSYSFNLLDGTKCYGCNGSGFQMVDLAAVAKRQAKSAAMNAEQLAERDARVARRMEIMAEINKPYGFDIWTLKGRDDLAFRFVKATGKQLEKHIEEIQSAVAM